MKSRTQILTAVAATAGALAAMAGLSGCNNDTDSGIPLTTLQANVKNVVVIYAENRSFDGLFGNFPGAHGLSEVVNADGTVKAAYHKQLERIDDTELATLPPAYGGATAAGNPTVIMQTETMGMDNAPFAMEDGYFKKNGAAKVTLDDTMHDMAHRFFENIMEINGGTNDKFSAWLDAGGLGMGHFDYQHSELYKLAGQYTLADNFFEAAYGGSFLNHQYLICACAPEAPASFVTRAASPPTLNTLTTANAKGVPQLASNGAVASALTSAPSLKSGNVAPLDYFSGTSGLGASGNGAGYFAVNTMQAPYEPSGNAPAAGAADVRYADPAAATTLPAQTAKTIGDRLNAKNVNWAWYAGAWNDAIVDGPLAPASRTVIYTPSTPRAAPDFQAHHHPFNYYAAFDPATHAADRTAHLKDYNDLLTQIAAGTLPPVVFYKPTGNVNQHPGYANTTDADTHIAGLVQRLQNSKQWNNMVIVITYDEYGGQWDHVAPPAGDKLGPGTRIPAIIISPFAKNTVDHTQYDTASIQRFINKVFGLDPLPGIKTRDDALVANGGVKMGDLTNALNL